MDLDRANRNYVRVEPIKELDVKRPGVRARGT